MQSKKELPEFSGIRTVVREQLFAGQLFAGQLIATIIIRADNCSHGQLRF